MASYRDEHGNRVCYLVAVNTPIIDPGGNRYGFYSAYLDSDGSLVANIYIGSDIATYLYRHRNGNRFVDAIGHTDANGHQSITIYTDADCQLHIYSRADFDAYSDGNARSANRHADRQRNSTIANLDSYH